MCKSRDPFFYTGVIDRARWRASLRNARCARYEVFHEEIKVFICLEMNITTLFTYNYTKFIDYISTIVQKLSDEGYIHWQ